MRWFLLIAAAACCLAVPLHANTLPGDSGMNSQGCSGSTHEPFLTFSFQITIISDGTGSACLENTNPLGTSWNSLQVTAPSDSFPAGGGDGGFGCTAGGPFGDCVPPSPILPAGSDGIWAFFGGNGVISAATCPISLDFVPIECLNAAHVQFNFIGFIPGTYTVDAAANVPEPATAALLAAGLSGLFSRRKRMLGK